MAAAVVEDARRDAPALHQLCLRERLLVPQPAIDDARASVSGVIQPETTRSSRGMSTVVSDHARDAWHYA
jgi:hypothetical protein